MTLNQRRIVGVLLIGLMFFDAVALHPMGPEVLRGPGDWARFWWGNVLAQVCLLASWAALRQQPWVNRLPMLLGLACLYGLILQGVASRYPAFRPAMAHGSVLVIPAAFLVMVLVLMLLRRMARWEVVLPEEVAVGGDAAPPRSAQFTIRHLFLWLTATAAFLGLSVWLLKVPPKTTMADGLGAIAAVLGVGALVAAFGLPMLVTCLGLVLGQRRRGRFALALVVVLLGLPAVFLGPSLLRIKGPINWPQWLGPLVRVGSVEIGFVGVFCGVLALARLCGYRLQRGRAEAPSPVRPRSHFALVVGLLVLAFLALCWPAAREREVRRWALVCQEWQETGVYAAKESDAGIILFVEPKKPMAQACRDRMDVPEYAAQVIGMNLANEPAIDAQMPSVAKLKRLRWLNLAKTGLTDAGLTRLYDLKELRSIDLTGTQVTAAGVAQLQQALPNCQISGAPSASPSP